MFLLQRSFLKCNDSNGFSLCYYRAGLWNESVRRSVLQELLHSIFAQPCHFVNIEAVDSTCTLRSNVGEGFFVSLSLNLNLNINLSLSVAPDTSGGPCSNT